MTMRICVECRWHEVAEGRQPQAISVYCNNPTLAAMRRTNIVTGEPSPYFREGDRSLAHDQRIIGICGMPGLFWEAKG